MAAVVLPFALAQAGVTLAQSATPAYQNNASEAQRKSNSSQASAELFYMIQQLQSDVQRLQGQVEEQKHLITRLQKQGRDRYIDLDQRILDLSEKTSSQTKPGPGQSDAGGGSDKPPVVQRDYRQPGPDEQKAYDQIQDLIHQKKNYDEAINKLYAFIDKYPEGDLLVNAYYWLGEVYLVKPQLEQAKQAFTIVATRYPDHRKAPDAFYKLGVTLDRLGEHSKAEERMKAVVEDYPASSAAKLARKFLASESR
jgi:tol-pal system protein YbgF